MNETISDSSALWISAGNIVRAGPEVDAIIKSLEAELGNYAETFSCEYEDDHEICDKGYLTTAYYFWSLLKAKGRGRPKIGYITYGFVFWRKQDEVSVGKKSWEGAQDSKIYVGYGPYSDGGWGYEDLYVRGDGSGCDENCKPTPPYLWEYVEEGATLGTKWRDRSWFYAVPMCSIDDNDDVRNKLVLPVAKLLQEEELDAKEWSDVGAYKSVS